MFILDSTVRSLQAKLASAVATNQLPIVASFVDVTATGYTPGANATQTNGSTAVDAVAAPAASTQRQVKLLTIRNSDTAAVTLTVQYNDNGTARIVWSGTLQVGETFVYTDGEGFRVLDNSGQIKQTTANAAIQAKDYIGGLLLEWVSTTSLRVKAGAAYVEGSAAVLNVAADITKSSLSLSNNTWYHVFLYNNAGTPDIEIVTTAPASPYFGNARSKTSDTSRRYLGSVRSNGSAGLWNFFMQGNSVRYREATNASPFRVASNQTATTETDVDCSAVVPVSSRLALFRLANVDTLVVVSVGTSDDTGSYIFQVDPAGRPFPIMALDSAQKFSYFFVSAPSSGFYADCLGFEVVR